MNKADLLKHFGSKSKYAAKALGVSRPTVSLWGDLVPWPYALLAEKITSGALVCDLSLYERFDYLTAEQKEDKELTKKK